MFSFNFINKNNFIPFYNIIHWKLRNVAMKYLQCLQCLQWSCAWCIFPILLKVEHHKIFQSDCIIYFSCSPPENNSQLWHCCFMYEYQSLQAGQQPREYFSFLQNLLNFIISKCSKKEVDDDFCVDERSPVASL